jgi:MoaA/NifB/PqqE/SkfB family radical SAM enzyme
MMELEMYKDIIRQIKEDQLTDTVNFHLMGEPTLHSDILEAAVFAKENGLKVSLTTNGSLISPEMVGKLMDVELDQILFSAQTPTEESFELRQVKMDFKRYKNNITDCLAMALDKGGKSKIVLSFLTTPLKILMPSSQMRTINNKKEMVSCFEDWMTDILAKCDPQGPAKKLLGDRETLTRGLSSMKLLGYNNLRVTDSFSLETRILGDWVHDSLTAKKFTPAKYGSCKGLTEYMGILWNGDMVYCCVDYEGKTNFGNVKSIGIKEAFNKKFVQSCLNGFKNYQVKHSYCQRCLGDVKPTYSYVRQGGSILYFMWYRKFWDKRRAEEKVLFD